MPTPEEIIQELLEMSASIRQAVLVKGDNEVLASTFANQDSEATMVGLSRSMLTAAREEAKSSGRADLGQMFVEAKSGCVFIAAADKDSWIAATTGTDPTIGLVLYDINTALRTAIESEAKGDYAK